MLKRRAMLRWFARISVVALLAVVAGLVSLAEPPAASASHDRLNLKSIGINRNLDESKDYLGFTLYFRHAQTNASQPVTDLHQLTVKYTVVPKDGASDADFNYDVALGEQVTYTNVGRLYYGKYYGKFDVDIPLVDDTVADPGERVEITLHEIGLTELGESTDGHTTGEYYVYDLNNVYLGPSVGHVLARNRIGERTWNFPIIDNDTVPDAPTNLTGEVWNEDRVHLKWKASESGGTVNGEEQPRRYQYRISTIGKPALSKPANEGWVDMEGRTSPPSPSRTRHQPGPLRLRLPGPGHKRGRSLTTGRNFHRDPEGLRAGAAAGTCGSGPRAPPRCCWNGTSPYTAGSSAGCRSGRATSTASRTSPPRGLQSPERKQARTRCTGTCQPTT